MFFSGVYFFDPFHASQQKRGSILLDHFIFFFLQLAGLVNLSSFFFHNVISDEFFSCVKTVVPEMFLQRVGSHEA